MGLLRSAALAAEFGFVVGTFVVIGVVGGRWVDEIFGTAPLALLAGILLSLAGSGFVMYCLFAWQQRSEA